VVADTTSALLASLQYTAHGADKAVVATLFRSAAGSAPRGCLSLHDKAVNSSGWRISWTCEK
jgi:hypothetical protein